MISHEPTGHLTADHLDFDWFGENVRTGKILTASGALVAVLAGGMALALGLWLTWSDIPDIRGNEPHVIFSVQKVLLGHALYGDPSVVPFDTTQYSPLYYAIVISLARVVGIPAQDPSGITFLCRSVSFSFTIALLLVLYLIMRQHLRVRAGVAIVACGFSVAVTSPWYFMSRPDTLMALCMFGAFYAALRSWRSAGKSAHYWVAAAALLSVLAAASKQNGIQAFGIIFVSWLLSRSWSKLGTASATYALGGLLAVGLTYRTLGPELWPNLVDGLDNGISFYNALWLCYEPFFPAFSLLVAFAGIAAIVWFRPARDPVVTFLSVSLVSVLGFAVVTALKVGSAANYFNEFKLMAAMTTAALLTNGSRVDAASRPRNGPIVILVAAYLVVFLAWWTTVQSYQFFYTRTEPGSIASAQSLRYSAYDELESWLQQELARSPGSYFFSFEWPVSNTLPEYCVAPQWGLTQLSFERGVVNYDRLCEMLESGAVRFIIARSEQLPPTLFGVSLQSFVRVGTISDCNIYEHRQSSADKVSNGRGAAARSAGRP